MEQYCRLVFRSSGSTGFLIFNLMPMALSGYYSLCDYNIIGSPSWVGIKNYVVLFSGQEKTFWLSPKPLFVCDYGGTGKFDFRLYDSPAFEL